MNYTERKSENMRLENDLKTHNKETCAKMKNTLQSNNKTCIIQPTGSGKSYLILKLIEDYAEQGRDIIVIEPQKYIFEQLQKKMEKYELSSDNIKFLTYSALGKLDEIKIQQFVSPKLVIVDEMHRAGAPIWGSGLKMMFDTFPEDCKYIGFSATPIRFLDGKRNMAKELFDGCIANEIGLADAILNRILPLPRYIAALYTYENEVNAITRKIQNSRNSDEEKEKLLEKVAILKRNLDKSKGVSTIFQKYVDRNKGKYIAFCRNIRHLKLMKSCLEQWFSEAGISCNFYEVHYQNLEKDNQFNAFMADDKLAVCLSVAMLSEGVHGIDGVILLRDTISPNLYYQQIGRVFAVDMDTVPIIFDLVANCESIMDCSLKNDLLCAIEKRDKEKMINEDPCINDEQENERVDGSNDCDKKEITREDIESFFVFDQVVDAVNAFKEIEKGLIQREVVKIAWHVRDEEVLRKNYHELGVKVKSLLSQERSDIEIFSKAHQLGLTRRSHREKWKTEKIVILKNNYSQYGTNGMKKKFFPQMGIRTIKKMADELGLIYIGNKWDNESKEFLIQNYKKMPKQELAKALNRTEGSISAMARKLNLRKRQ